MEAKALGRLVDFWEKELPKVKNAPLPFGIGVVMGGTAIYLLYAIFLIPGKDSTITLLQQERDSLRDAQKQNGSGNAAKTDTKQDIRTFLEDINSEILQKVDAGQKRILISVSIPKQIELLGLSKQHLDFSNYLSFRQIGPNDDINEADLTNRIDEKNDYGWKQACFLFPKDALKK